MTGPSMAEIYEQEGWTSHSTIEAANGIAVNGGSISLPVETVALSPKRSSDGRDGVMIAPFTEAEARALGERFAGSVELLRHLGLITGEPLDRLEPGNGGVGLTANDAIADARPRRTLGGAALPLAALKTVCAPAEIPVA